MISHPSLSLYSLATAAERLAATHEHADPARFDGKRCDRPCMACLLEAKARLYGRAGDAARACADGGPEPGTMAGEA